MSKNTHGPPRRSDPDSVLVASHPILEYAGLQMPQQHASLRLALGEKQSLLPTNNQFTGVEYGVHQSLPQMLTQPSSRGLLPQLQLEDSRLGAHPAIRSNSIESPFFRGSSPTLPSLPLHQTLIPASRVSFDYPVDYPLRGGITPPSEIGHRASVSLLPPHYVSGFQQSNPPNYPFFSLGDSVKSKGTQTSIDSRLLLLQQEQHQQLLNQQPYESTHSAFNGFDGLPLHHQVQMHHQTHNGFEQHLNPLQQFSSSTSNPSEASAWFKLDEPNGQYRPHRPKPVPPSEEVLFIPQFTQKHMESHTTIEKTSKKKRQKRPAPSCSGSEKDEDEAGESELGNSKSKSSEETSSSSHYHQSTISSSTTVTSLLGPSKESFADSYVKLNGQRISIMSLKQDGEIIVLKSQPSKYQVKDFNIIPTLVLKVSSDFSRRTCDFVKATLICDEALQIEDPIFLSAVCAKNYDDSSELSFVNLRVTKEMLRGRTKGFGFTVCFTYCAGPQELESIYTTPFWLFSNVNQEGFPKSERDGYLRPQWRDSSTGFTAKRKR